MDKTPISIALERQIPEFIREEYVVFVEFIKAYYAFLDETQQRNLEDIRSIENTLDEFVIRFKKELSVIFPTNSLANERFILQRIREFYKTRGSSESFKFLFRTLFNKEAEIYYPSKQILRASDGSWILEKSVFVEVTEGDLFSLSGKIINIVTDMKTISVFCPRVVYYRENIYEVFIDRSYIADIATGNTVSSSDGLYSGTIIQCPSKYTIVSAGSGFEIGGLYHLPSETGNGSLVKITRIDANGAIKKIQIISFALDYESVFYAKLSNKTRQAFAYYNAITSFTVGAGHPAGLYPTTSFTNLNPHADGTTGYIDLGYISRQNYFAYDSAYLPSNTSETVFYADGTYVGEIVGSFYTNNSNDNVIDETLAEIKIELGPVAVYPGYYSKNDGFISDESFIQDGKYYQLFSYVIKVEQQVDSYRDIVKALLHPAGFEMFAEYNIKNTYLLSASPLQAFIRRQFIDQEYVTDDGSAKTVYKFLDDLQNAYHSDATDIKDVIKGVTETAIPFIESKYYDMNKGSAGAPVENSLTTSYHADATDIKDNAKKATDTTPAYHIDTTDIKDIIRGTTVDTTLSYHIDTTDIKNVIRGTTVDTTTAYHIDTTDIKDVNAKYEELETINEELNRTVVYNRSIIPLATDATTNIDDYRSLFTPSTYTETFATAGGDWSWNGTAYILNYPEIRIGSGYIRTPDLTGLQATLVAGSNLVTLTAGTTAGMYNGLMLSVSSGSGAFGALSRIFNIIDSTSFTTTVNHTTSGSIAFIVNGDTPQLAETLSSPTDIGPDGSTQGLVKFAFSGNSWNQIASTIDATSRVIAYDRATVPLATDSMNAIDAGPDGSIQGVVKFAFSGSSWTDNTVSGDSIPLLVYTNKYVDSINNTNTGTLYYNAYNQNDAADPNTSYSYEAEVYSVRDTRAIS